MTLTTIFQVSVHGLAALSAVMLAFGEGSPFPALLTVPLAAVAFLVNERHHFLRIGTLWTNLMGIVALGLVVSEFFGPNADARLLAGAHFLVYLTWIVMFQDKRFRQYWWLLALGMLQVAVGSVLTNSGWWGCLLFFYLLLAVWTMAVFNLYRGAATFGMLDSPAAPGKSVSGPAREAMATPVVTTEAALAALFRPSQRSQIRHAVQQDRPGRWVSPRFVCGIAAISLLGLVLGLLVFLLVPRIEHGARQSLVGRTNTAVSVRTGFSTSVRLGHLGRILESNERVMQVLLYEGTPDRRLRIEDFAAYYGLEEPLFRGSVLDTYQSGNWKGNDRGISPMAMSRAQPRPGVVCQEIRLFYPESPVLFAMRPAWRVNVIEPNERVFTNETGVLTAGDEIHEDIKYQVLSKWPDTGGDVAYRPFEDMKVVPASTVLPAPPPGARSGVPVDPYLQLPEFGLERLRELARKIADEERGNFGPDTSLEMRQARRIVTWLRDSGTFSYSLNMTVVNSVIDPVEDFLFNRRSGHCEYFASALALMLRAVDIPSRLVTGYKGAEPNSSAGNYDVMQRHAHAWVEAAIDGEWVVLDATPAERDENVRNRLANAGLWTSARDHLSSLWSNYVVSMSSSRQREAFYNPLLGSLTEGLTSARDAFLDWTTSAARFAAGLHNPQRILSATGILSLMVLLAAATWLVMLLRAAAGRLVRRWPGADIWRPGWLRRFFGGRSGSQFVVGFYQRFVRLMSASGLEPGAGQTPREFARQVEVALGGALQSADLASLPEELTELYYRVRFGGQTLATVDSESLESRLRLMEQRLSALDRQPASA